MTLAPLGRILFGSLDLWFTPFEVDPVFKLLCHLLTATPRPQDHNGTVIPNKYNINLSRNKWSQSFHPTATFRSHGLPDGGEIEPPSPQLLAHHAYCSRVAQMSGVTGYLEERFRPEHVSFKLLCAQLGGRAPPPPF